MRFVHGLRVVIALARCAAIGAQAVQRLVATQQHQISECQLATGVRTLHARVRFDDNRSGSRNVIGSRFCGRRWLRMPGQCVRFEQRCGAKNLIAESDAARMPLLWRMFCAAMMLQHRAVGERAHAHVALVRAAFVGLGGMCRSVTMRCAFVLIARRFSGERLAALRARECGDDWRRFRWAVLVFEVFLM